MTKKIQQTSPTKPIGAAWLAVCLLFACLPPISTCGAASNAAPTGLMCELMAMPELTEIEARRPDFGWIGGSTAQADAQTAYQVLMASSRELLAQDTADMWDSGKVMSAESINIEYAGKPLASKTTYHWKVRTWNQADQPSPYSQIQTFHTGSLEGPYVTTRYPLVTTAVEPVRVVEKGPGHYFVDFGKAAFGTIELTATSDIAGAQIEVHLGEVPSGDAGVHPNPGGSLRYRRMIQTLDTGTHTYKVAIRPDRRNTGREAIRMPDYIGEVMPFRYCELLNVPSPIDASNVRQIAAHYPFDKDASDFTSSDPVLNDVWSLCKYSIKATSFCGVYVDGDRERIPYEGDAYINQLCHYAVDREFNMARYTHEYLITRPTWPTEWILHSVLMAWADYLHTANTKSIEHFYEDLKAKTLIALAREDGLISTRTGLVTPEVLASIHFSGEIRDLVDWPHGNILGLDGGYGETDDFVFRPINTVVNAFHYRALIVMGRMAKAIGEEADAQYFAKRAERVKQSFNDTLLDKDKGIYVDGEGTTHSALHANMFPLAFGLVPPEYVLSVTEFIKGRGMVCSVYGAQYLLEALYQAGEDDYALNLMTDTETDRSWPHMIYNVGTTITMEAWDAKYKPNLDWNHAWGAAPANIIPRYLMGIQAIEPGFAKVRVKPQVGSLKDGRIKLPTIRGPISADFSRAENQSFTLNVHTPAGVEAVVYLPRLGHDNPGVLVNGQTVQARLAGEFVVLEGIGPGAHRFQRSSTPTQEN